MKPGHVYAALAYSAARFIVAAALLVSGTWLALGPRAAGVVLILAGAAVLLAGGKRGTS